MNNLPIGIFDSGLGGLTVVKAINRVLPKENIIYFGDTARVPYGNRSSATIQKFALEDAQFLLKQKIKCLVIACHTMSAVAKDIILKKIKLPIFDTVTPTLTEAEKYNKVGIIATFATINSNVYQRKIKNLHCQACPLLVPLIEEGEIRGNILKSVLNKYLLPFQNLKLPVLILGCTHYPYIKTEIQKYIPTTKLIDSADYLAKNLKSYLILNQLTASNSKPRHIFYVSDITKSFLGNSLPGKLRKINLND